jgi:hypothetical protein
MTILLFMLSYSAVTMVAADWLSQLDPEPTGAAASLILLGVLSLLTSTSLLVTSAQRFHRRVGVVQSLMGGAISAAASSAVLGSSYVGIPFSLVLSGSFVLSGALAVLVSLACTHKDGSRVA